MKQIPFGNSLHRRQQERRAFLSLPSSKVCGHNEATMFFLRPHAGLEVLNLRVYSQASPAPGNDAGGHEVCLKFLRIACAATRRGGEFWDTECMA